jgi:hypothetical protein
MLGFLAWRLGAASSAKTEIEQPNPGILMA